MLQEINKANNPMTMPKGWKSVERRTIEDELRRQRVGKELSSLAPDRLSALTGIDLAIVRKVLQNLRQDGLIVNTGTPQQPKYRLKEATDPEVKPTPYLYTRETYKGEELKPYEGRPGAMDAFTLPSIKDGARVPYKGIRPQLVGALKDNSNNAR